MIEPQSPHHNRPLFIVGSGRSGTTLLYHMLLVSGDFPIYRSETRILPARHHYGDFDDPASRERFLSDFLRSRQFARSGLTPEQVTEAARDGGDYAGFLVEFMDRMATAQGKHRWVEKTPAHIEHMTRLAERLPASRFLHIVRDGRDVALSIRKLGWVPRLGGDPFRQLLWAGERWAYLLDIARRQARGFPDRYLEIRYEDLILDPDRVLGEVAEFADVELDAEAVRDSELGSLGKPNTAFGEAASSSPANAVYRWKKHPARIEIDRLTLALGPTLGRFGYEVPPTGLGGVGRASIRLSGWLFERAIRVKEWLRWKTPLGRRTGSPLEIGLD